METSQKVKILKAALKSFGPKGEKWGGSSGSNCAWIAIYNVAFPAPKFPPEGECGRWARVLGFKSSDELFNWNDAEDRKFSEIRARFNAAIKKLTAKKST